MKCGSDPYKPQGFLIERIYNTYRDTYIIFINGIFFIAEIADNYKKIRYFAKCKGHGSSMKHGNYINAPFFHPLSSSNC